jgi:ubiquinol oxidase
MHYAPQDWRDRVALRVVKLMRTVPDMFFAKRYGHRAVILETVAAVPGMVGGLLQHLRAIRHIRDDQGWIKELIEEADNERMHLMAFIHIAQPSRFERFLIMAVQLVFYNFYFFLSLLAPRVAHRLEIDARKIENIEAPDIAKEYWNLPDDARLRDLVLVIRADEAAHRDTNHTFANAIVDKSAP